MLQHPTVPTQASGRVREYSRDTTPLLKTQQAECSSAGNGGDGMCWAPRRGHFHSLSAILCEADGPGTLSHLAVGNPQRTCEVIGLTLYLSPLSLCQQNFPAIPLSLPTLSLSGTVPSLSPRHLDVG